MLDFLIPYFPTIASAGDLATLLPILLFLASWCAFSNDVRGSFLLFTMTGVLLVGVGVLKVIANFYGLPWRPNWETISNLFPSGHIAMSIWIYGAATICAHRADRIFGWLAATATTLYIIALSIERVGSGAHPYLDVLGGAILGLVALITALCLWPRRPLKRAGLPIIIALSAMSFYILGNWNMPTVSWVELASQLIRKL